jgi:hypothetical protein
MGAAMDSFPVDPNGPNIGIHFDTNLPLFTDRAYGIWNNTQKPVARSPWLSSTEMGVDYSFAPNFARPGTLGCFFDCLSADASLVGQDLQITVTVSQGATVKVFPLDATPMLAGTGSGTPIAQAEVNVGIPLA